MIWFYLSRNPDLMVDGLDAHDARQSLQAHAARSDHLRGHHRSGLRLGSGVPHRTRPWPCTSCSGDPARSTSSRPWRTTHGETGDPQPRTTRRRRATRPPRRTPGRCRLARPTAPPTARGRRGPTWNARISSGSVHPGVPARGRCAERSRGVVRPRPRSRPRAWLAHVLQVLPLGPADPRRSARGPCPGTTVAGSRASMRLDAAISSLSKVPSQPIGVHDGRGCRRWNTMLLGRQVPHDVAGRVRPDRRRADAPPSRRGRGPCRRRAAWWAA